MQISIEQKTDWMKEAEIKLIKQALSQTTTRQEAADLLGIKRRTLYSKMQDYKIVSQIKVCEKPQLFTKLCKLGFSIDTVADIYSCSSVTVRAKIRENIGQIGYKALLAEHKYINHKRKLMNLDITNVVQKHRQEVCELIEKIRENKLDELTLEHRLFTEVLYKNEYIDEKGVITEKGIEELYH